MTRISFRLALRNLFRNKLTSSINIFGFSVGIAAFLLIVSYIKYEKGHDTFYTDAEDIYRVGINFENDGRLVDGSMVQYPVASKLENEFSEVRKVSRAWSNYNLVVEREGKKNYEKNVYNVDPTFPQMFCKMVIGDAKTVLQGNKNVIISEEIAKKYFADENPIGKNLVISDYGEHIVTGIFEDRSEKSHFDFEILIPIDQLKSDYEDNWESHNFYTYIQLDHRASSDEFTEKMNEMIQIIRADRLAETGVNEILYLQKVGDIRLYSNSLLDFKRNGYGSYIPFFVLTAVIILLFATLNYLNFSSVQALEKSKAIGINRILGAEKKAIVGLFLVESFTFIAISTIIGAALAIILFPVFADYYRMTYEINLVTSFWFWLYLFLILVINTFVAGIYPAAMSLSFKISNVIKGTSERAHKYSLKNILTIVQYTTSCLLIIFALVSFEQIEYLRNHDLGFAKKNVLIAREPVILEDNINYTQTFQLLKDATSDIPSVIDISFSDYVPGGQYERFDRIKLKSGNKIHDTFMNSVSANYLDFYQINLLSGRNFSEDNVNDYHSSVIVNEKLANILGFTSEEAVSQQIEFDGTKDIIGVISDFHQESLKKETAPLLLFLTDWPGYFSIKLTETNISQTTAEIANAWNEIFPGDIFNYFYLEEYFDHNYIKDNKAWHILRLYSLIAIFISILGLLGTASHQIKRRKKEIAMYKILGANHFNIFWVFQKKIFFLIAISFLIGLPLQYFALKEWLATFPYRINVNILHFVVPLSILLSITFITIGSQVMKVVSSNLVNALRSE